MYSVSRNTEDRNASRIATTATAAASTEGAPNNQGGKPIANESEDSNHDQPGQADTEADDGGRDSIYATRLVTELLAGRNPRPQIPVNAMDEDVFYSAQAPPDEQREAEDEAGPDISYQEPTTDQVLPQPDFKPFFTLIEDLESGEIHHPAVHYVFADDDQEILSDAALAAIDGSEAAHAGADIDERILLVDIGADGKTTLNATSLSPQWQNVKATTRQAPNFWQAGADGDAGMMLRISGQEMTSTRRVHQAAGLDELVRTFEEKLDGLENVLGIHARDMPSKTAHSKVLQPS